MKLFSLIMKLVAALAAVAGIVYVVATYGDKIVAWAKNMLNKFRSCDCDCDCDCECECDCDADCEECPCEADCDECPCCATCEAEVIEEAEEAEEVEETPAEADFEA